MPKRKYRVALTEEQRQKLEEIVSIGRASPGERRRAQVLLLLDESPVGPAVTSAQIAEQIGVATSTVDVLRKKFCVEGLEASLARRARPRGPYKLDEPLRTKLVRLAQSDPPWGFGRWSLRSLAEHVREGVDIEISHESLRKILAEEGVSLAGENDLGGFDVVGAAREAGLLD